MCMLLLNSWNHFESRYCTGPMLLWFTDTLSVPIITSTHTPSHQLTCVVAAFYFLWGLSFLFDIQHQNHLCSSSVYRKNTFAVWSNQSSIKSFVMMIHTFWGYSTRSNPIRSEIHLVQILTIGANVRRTNSIVFKYSNNQIHKPSINYSSIPHSNENVNCKFTAVNYT